MPPVIPACSACVHSALDFHTEESTGNLIPIRRCHFNPPWILEGDQFHRGCFIAVADDDYCSHFEKL